VRLCLHEEPTPEEQYLFLGYNVIVPPYVRRGLLSRTLTNDDLLPRLRKPVLITHGADDAVVLSAAAEQHKAAIAHAKLSLYPNVGHAPFWEAPERFNRELREFAEQ
jgi:non-heme chloroperoxidase